MAFQQYDSLVDKFKDGNFPTGQDFNDLIDSTYNFSLSNLPEIGTFIQATSGEWQAAYDTTAALSGNWALKSEVLFLSGGIVQGSLNVQGALLSGSNDLYNIFQSKASDFQKLSFVKETSLLSLTNGNTVSLSGIQGFNTIVFTHSPFTPVSNQTYYFGPISTISPALNIRQSRQLVSQFSGEVVEASLTTDHVTPGGLQDTTLMLANRTKNQTAIIKGDVLYRTVESTVLNVPLNTAPVDFTGTNVTFDSDGCKFLNDTTSALRLTTPLNGLPFEYYIIKFQSSAYGIGSSNGRIEVYYSTALAPAPLSSFITRSDLRGVINDSNTLLTSTIVLSSSDVITAPNISFRFKTLVGTGFQRMSNLEIIGINSNSNNIGNYPLSLIVDAGDILEARMITPSWDIAPTGVVNYITAKIKTIN
jgi:hypothetical protein